MSKVEFWQRGEALDYTNSSNDTIEAGSVVVFGTRIGVAGCDIKPGATEPGSLHVEGVFSFAKSTSAAITAGAEVYFNATDGEITTTANGNTKAGYAVEAAAKDATTVLVKINA